ncbi:MAG: hypothetical protein A3I68_02880 [Candidatus Melainabacteria bacterium RIFCSPLOWO2_02_FULL_35_15]|nr:MAG: hypothetical protein A3F80_01135 [Candidatus Melainabacteria bacterium RIFCSPLOWO2_12_FULL_35_11]OGI13072.1 MAG: hypothetical protein A3I68_02880 [Candidatus Melainabacteria bacterium RIFCSPLOWO2_02_FULL_35_15]
MREKIVFLILILNIYAFNLRCIAKINFNEKNIVTVPAKCTIAGELNCPKGFKTSCPKQYKPSCVFVGTTHLPACLADSADDTFYSFDLSKITCEKK